MVICSIDLSHLVCVDLGVPLLYTRQCAGLGVSAEGGGLRQAHLPAPVNGTQEGPAVGTPYGCALVTPRPHHLNQ